ncbi:unnamed protein product [Trichogramma brassicae]|uniref:Uncharacterized protein n=1 Tax=Trichogramma brassicae TaxID=86971 RepID=A0A6H5ID04_9HYME|nr:unnamed protein product [Trichogramma brassicae]
MEHRSLISWLAPATRTSPKSMKTVSHCCVALPIHRAARNIQNRSVPDLFKIFNRFDVNCIDETGLSHFLVACKFGCHEVVEKFLELGQDPNYIMEKTGDSLLHLALTKGHEKLVELLLSKGADPNLANDEGSTPLHVISQRNILSNLLERFFEICDEKNQFVRIDAQDKLGDSPLHLSLKHSNPKVAELLLRRGADPNLANKEGSTALHRIEKRAVDDFMMKFFIKINEDTNRRLLVDAQDKNGDTPLHLAVRYSKKKSIESLLRYGADANLANEEGLTPLHIICIQDIFQTASAEIFFKTCDEMKQKVQVNARDKKGRTPLQLAVATFKAPVVDAILNHDADLSSFVFPTESYFDEILSRNSFKWSQYYQLKLASGALAVVEHLEKRGYELDRDDALMIMKLFAKCGLFETSARLEKNHQEAAKKVRFDTSLSLHDLIKLRPKEAKKLVAHSDCNQLVNKMLKLPWKSRDACAAPLCDMLMRGFLLDWALDSFVELIHCRLPTLCCDMIIEQLRNKDLYHICLAAAGRSS